MKILITASPRFEIPMSLRLVTLLCEMSGNHYDFVCRTASMPGGFLYGWKNRVGGTVCWDTVDATAQQIDIVLKITEMVHGFPEQTIVELVELRKALYGVVKCAEQKLSHWSHKYEAK